MSDSRGQFFRHPPSAICYPQDPPTPPYSQTTRTAQDQSNAAKPLTLPAVVRCALRAVATQASMFWPNGCLVPTMRADKRDAHGTVLKSLMTWLAAGHSIGGSPPDSESLRFTIRRCRFDRIRRYPKEMASSAGRYRPARAFRLRARHQVLVRASAIDLGNGQSPP